MDFFKKAINALLVDAFGGLEDVEIHANFRGQVNEGLNVFREAETAISQASLEELAANARVQAHGASDFFDVSAKLLAQIGDDIRVADFECEKRVGSVFDELGAADGGDQEFRSLARRTRSIVNGAAKTPLKYGAVDLPEFCGGGRILDVHDDAVGVKEVSDGSSFAKKFGIRSHAEFHITVPGIS